VQSQLERLIEKNYYLNRSARDAYRSYVLAYSSHSLKHIFKPDDLDLEAVARGFGFTTPPRVNLNIKAVGERPRKHGGGGGMGDPAKRRMSAYADEGRRGMAMDKLASLQGQRGKGAFSEENPYGRR